MSEKRVKHVPSHVVVGCYGYEVTRGYTEVGGLRIYEDQVHVGRYGQAILSPGRSERVVGEDRRREAPHV